MPQPQILEPVIIRKGEATLMMLPRTTDASAKIMSNEWEVAFPCPVPDTIISDEFLAIYEQAKADDEAGLSEEFPT